MIFSDIVEDQTRSNQATLQRIQEQEKRLRSSKGKLFPQTQSKNLDGGYGFSKKPFSIRIQSSNPSNTNDHTHPLRLLSLLQR